LQNSRKRWTQLRKLKHEKEQHIRSTANKSGDRGTNIVIYIYNGGKINVHTNSKKQVVLLINNVMELPINILKNIHTYIHTYLHTHIHTHIKTIHTYIHTYIHTNTYIYTHIHIHIYTYLYTHKHTYMHTYIHIHT